MQEEIFGPLLPIVTYKHIDEAIAYANDREAPLDVYYFGHKTGPNRFKVQDQIPSGALVVNETIYQVINSDLPFGGVGHSGYGRYHGKAGFVQFSNPKSMLVRPPLDFYPFN